MPRLPAVVGGTGVPPVMGGTGVPPVMGGTGVPPVGLSDGASKHMTVRIALARLLTAASCFLSLGTTIAAATGFETSQHVDFERFREPPREFRQQAWMTYNLSRATEENMTAQIRQWAAQDLAGGFYLGMGGGSTTGLSAEYLEGSGRKASDAGIAFLSEEYFALYAKIIEAGKQAGMPPMVFYDEWGYPSGIAGGVLYSKFPQYAAKSLEKVERDVTGPATATLDVPVGITLGAVRMDLESRALVDVSAELADGGRRLACAVPTGRWKVMAFYLDPKASLGQGNKSGYVDYLDPEAVRASATRRITTT